MSSSSRLADIEVAQILLNLHGNVRDRDENASRYTSEDMEAAKLFLNFVIVSNNSQASGKSTDSAVDDSGLLSISPACVETPSYGGETAEQPATLTEASKRRSGHHYIAEKNAIAGTSSEESKPGDQIQGQEQPTVTDQSTDFITVEASSDTWQRKRYVQTRDAEIQTDDKIIELESTVTKLTKQTKTLLSEMEIIKSQSSCNHAEMDSDTSATTITSVGSGSNAFNLKDSRDEMRCKHKAGPSRVGVKSTKILANSNTNSHRSDGMVPIGDGKTLIPENIISHINWNSYTSATRKLLNAVFSRKTLATHCLTGKHSPAFQMKPAKNILNPVAVSDIVQTVMERCGVPKRLVRSSVTTKCADESKMFRTRQMKRNKLRSKSENVIPDSES